MTTVFKRSFYRVLCVLHHQTRYIRLAVTMLAMLISTLGLTPGLQPVVGAASLAPATAAQVRSVPLLDAPIVVPVPSTPTPLAPTALSSVAMVAPQNCTAPAYSLPAPAVLVTAANGLAQTIEATAYYQVYGNTVAQIKAQLLRCAPIMSPSAGGSFAAQTGGSLTWQYSADADAAGMCTMSAVKVGLRTNMILPAWRSTVSAADGLAGSWQSLITSLTTHENGHIAIYQQYANQLLGDLQTLPPVACNAITAAVDAKAAADIAALNTAQADYDARTGNGVKQGAILR